MKRLSIGILTCLQPGCGQLPPEPQPEPVSIPLAVRQACAELGDDLINLAVQGVEGHFDQGLPRTDSVDIALETCDFVCRSGDCEDRCENCVERVHDFVYDAP